VLAACAACDTSRGLTVEFYIEDGYRFSPTERDRIETIAGGAVSEVRRYLPTLPPEVILKVYPGTDVIPETGETGYTGGTDRVFWIVDPHRLGGVVGTATRELRGTLFHELHHLARSQTQESVTLMQRVVGEGLATVFERDAAGMPAPWGKYPPDAGAWTKELLALPSDTSFKPWMSRHPDGRRWIGYKVGTYVVERAMRASHKSAAELVHTSTADILRLAGFDATAPEK
jgi:uncharacterized protein YjaZ